VTEKTGEDWFRIRQHVAEFDTIVAAFKHRSQETRAHLRCELDLSYGSAPGEKLDIFYPVGLTTRTPVHIFVHGGYWRMFSKDDFSFVADTVTAAGAIAVIVDYVLMPTQRMAVLVEQVRTAVTWVSREIMMQGGDPSSLSVSGHSAGAHLASWLLDKRDSSHRDYQLRSVLLLGGLYDLTPLQQSFLQAEIHLTNEEVQRWTPLSVDHQTSTRYRILVGERETPPFHDQAIRLQAKLTAQGCDAQSHIVPGTNHMSSMLSLGDPDSFAGCQLTACIRD
jgi:arylformamidase